MKKNGVFLFVISHLVPEILKIFILCKLGTDGFVGARTIGCSIQSFLNEWS